MRSDAGANPRARPASTTEVGTVMMFDRGRTRCDVVIARNRAKGRTAVAVYRWEE